MKKTSLFWKIIYTCYPPLLRVLEKIKIHSFRQDYLIGVLKKDASVKNLQEFLLSQGYEDCVLAWKDPGEILSMRKIDKEIFQYHVRLFDDGEFRCHYEYSSEGNPWGHVTEKVFERRSHYFKGLLKDFLD